MKISGDSILNTKSYKEKKTEISPDIYQNSTLLMNQENSSTKNKQSLLGNLNN